MDAERHLTGAPDAVATVLSLRGLSKSFGGSRALHDVDLDVGRGEIRALVGHNGSGKSTLIKILSGFHRPDAGELCLHGETVATPVSASDLRAHHVAFLHQDLALVPTLSVLENLRVGRLARSRGRIAWRAECRRASELLAAHGLHVDPRTPVAHLSQVQRTILGLARALDAVDHDGGASAGGAGPRTGLVVLDEPTSALPASEVEALFHAIRALGSAGHSVVLVTHHLDEVFAVADSVTVLRGGRALETTPVAETTKDALVRAMVGGDLPPLIATPARSRATAVMRCRGLAGAGCESLELEISGGEILGLTGLLGAGHSEIPYLLYGARERRGGTVWVGERELRRATPAAARAAGLALLPADRSRDSGVMGATVAENVSLPGLRALRRPWGLDHGGERTAVEALLRRFDVRPARPELPLASLSGGNQQKALLGRWIEQEPRVLLLDEPSNGIDVLARQAIFRTLQECAAAGMAVLIASSQVEDIAAICTRALVLRHGHVTAELAGDEISAARLLSACHGSPPAADVATTA